MQKLQKLAFAALAIGLAACGGGSNNPTNKTDAPAGSNIDAGSGNPSVCDPITQTGCSTGERCTWVQQTQSVGFVGCQPNGTVPAGGACMFGSAFPKTDNCEAGYACPGGTCEALCDPNGSDSCGSNGTCTSYDAFYQVGNSPAEAGMCSPNCNPVVDNSFGSGADSIPPGSGLCGSNQGCYGGFSQTDPTTFSCAPELNTTVIHRTTCDMTNGCAPDTTSVYSNGCAQGYAAGYYPTTGATTVVCLAYCLPQDCYQGTCGSNNLAQIGTAPHACAHSAIRVDPSYTLNESSPSNSCTYGWWFEEGSDGVVDSPFDNNVGICYDHAEYVLTGGDGSGQAFPACDTLPGSGSAGPYGLVAGDLGCVSTTTAEAQGYFGPGANIKRRATRELPDGVVIDKPYFPTLRGRAR